MKKTFVLSALVALLAAVTLAPAPAAADTGRAGTELSSVQARDVITIPQGLGLFMDWILKVFGMGDAGTGSQTPSRMYGEGGVLTVPDGVSGQGGVISVPDGFAEPSAWPNLDPNG